MTHAAFCSKRNIPLKKMHFPYIVGINTEISLELYTNITIYVNH